MKKALIIMNPAAGTQRANKHLTRILDAYCKADFETVIAMTAKRGDATEIAAARGGDADLVVAIGGDGTFNEVVDGLMTAGIKVPVGYIPAGSTNDFASSLNISKNIIHAASDSIRGVHRNIDIGRFNDRYFSYVASFGAFTDTSYSVPQNLKNILGHTAYILGGIKDILNIHPMEVKLECEEGTFEGRYIFGAICNSTSMGGVITLNDDEVDLNDGLFEVMLIKMPRNIIEMNQIILALTTHGYKTCPCIEFFSTGKLKITAPKDMDWTLDGEYQEGTENIVIENIYSAIELITREKRKPQTY